MPRQRPGTSDPANGERVRRRLVASPEIDLTEEEIRALVDDGLDPDEVRRAAREPHDPIEASDHDRDTARDELEGLAAEVDDDY